MAAQERPVRLKAAILALSTTFARPSQALPLSPGIAEASSYPLSNQAPFQFSHCSQDGEHPLPCGCARVHLFGEGDELDPQGLEGSERPQQLRDGACEGDTSK